MLTHVDEQDRPSMVDVGAKNPSSRMAHARAVVELPEELAAQFRGGELRTKKGPVFQTAIIAGVMAAKRTHELIPFCHPIGLDNCKIDIAMGGGNQVMIDCVAEVTHKTGVEMEALTGASVAALTVYDMCKAISHEIVIREVMLVEKRGGKRGYVRADPAAPGPGTA